MCSAELSHAHWRNSSFHKCSVPHTHFSTPYPRGQVLSASLTFCKREATILSVDGVGAYDTISRNAMLADMVDGDKLILFIRQFYDTHSCEKMSWGRPGKWSRVKWVSKETP